MNIKQKIYFLIAKYFQFWARIVLNRWKPYIIAVVGSAGKTSTLYLIEHVLKDRVKVKVSHKTNAASSIPLNILGLKQESFSITEWIKLFLTAPFRIFVKYEETIYLCEMDSDRANEMKIHTDLIKPDIVCIPSLYATHTENFEGESKEEILEKVAWDFGYAIERCKGFILANGDNKLIKKQITRTKKPVLWISNYENDKSVLKLIKHEISLAGTRMEFEFNTDKIIETLCVIPAKAGIYSNSNENRFPILNFRGCCPFNQFENDNNKIEVRFPYALMSEINSYSVGMVILTAIIVETRLIASLRINEILEKLKSWRLPPGRMSIFAGRKATTIIDSSYNASRLATIDAIKVLAKIGGEKTVLVLGDMRELGVLSKYEHELVAEEIIKSKVRRVILVGPMMSEFVCPKLVESGYGENRTVFKILNPQWAVDLLKSEDFLKTGETILVKGSQNTLFLEGIIEQILASKKDIDRLCRREKIWEEKRKEIYK